MWLPCHILHRGKCIFGGNKAIIKKQKKLPSGKKTALELLHQRLGYRSTRSFMAGDTDNFWEYIELKIDPDPLCTSY